jgi:solute carrier family 30 (zinc transporter), member 9
MQAACTSPEVPSAQNDSLKDVMDLAMLEVGRGVIRTMGEEVDRLEDELRKMIPGLRYVDLETDRGRFGDCTAMECIIKSTDEDK